TSFPSFTSLTSAHSSPPCPQAQPLHLSFRTTLEHHFPRNSFPSPGFLPVFGPEESSPARGGKTEVLSADNLKFSEARPLPRRVTMKSYLSRLTLGVASAALMLFSVGCGGGSSSSGGNPPPQQQTGTVNMLISDASTEDWATIGVKVISITLTPQGGGNDVTLYTAPSPAPTVNLLQLDQLSEILGN